MVREVLGGTARRTLAGLAEGTAGASMVALTQCDMFGVWQTPRSSCQALLPPCSPGVFQRKLNPHVSDLLTLTTHLKVVLQEWFGPKEPGGLSLGLLLFTLKCRPVHLHNKYHAYEVRGQLCLTQTSCPGPTRDREPKSTSKDKRRLSNLDTPLEADTADARPTGLHQAPPAGGKTREWCGRGLLTASLLRSLPAK